MFKLGFYLLEVKFREAFCDKTSNNRWLAARAKDPFIISLNNKNVQIIISMLS